VKKARREKPRDTSGLAEMNVEGLTRIVYLMVACMATCDARGISVPPDFVAHFGAVRHHLMRKCIGPDYSEMEFREFFGVLLKTACEQHSATAARLDALQATNQLTQ
jgi:hypothetical protein